MKASLALPDLRIGQHVTLAGSTALLKILAFKQFDRGAWRAVVHFLCDPSPQKITMTYSVYQLHPISAPETERVLQ